MTERLPTRQDELGNLEAAAAQDAGLQRMLKFRKGAFYIGEEEVDAGTEYIAHPIGWTKCWIKFVNNQFIERKVYRVASTVRVPDRDELGDMDSALWGPGMQGEHTDPWSMQYLLPLEDPESGEIVVFVTPSTGGKRAVSELCGTYARRASRDKNLGLPLVSLRAGEMKTGKYGTVDRPIFKIEGWTNTPHDEPKTAVASAALSAGTDLDDEIPF